MRIENWDSWLVRFALAAKGQRFVWGRTDCVTLTRRGLTQMLGVDPWQGHVKKFKTKRAALLEMNDIDPEITLRDTGATEAGYHFGTSGDVALGPTRDRHGLIAVSLLLPGRKALVSTQELGVLILDKLELPSETRFFRYV